MDKKIVRVLTGGCVVNTVLICAIYILRELWGKFSRDALPPEITIRMFFSVLLISFVVSAADLLLLDPSAVSVILHYAATIAGILLVLRLIRGKYEGGMQIVAIVMLYTVIYAVVIGVRLLVRYLLRRKKEEKKEYSSVFK